MMFIIQSRYRFSQRLNTRRRPILPPMQSNIHLLWPLKTPFNLIIDLRSSLAQVRPGVRIIEEAVLVGTLGGPDDAGGRAGRVQPGVRTVALMRLAELAMDFGVEFFKRVYIRIAV